MFLNPCTVENILHPWTRESALQLSATHWGIKLRVELLQLDKWRITFFFQIRILATLLGIGAKALRGGNLASFGAKREILEDLFQGCHY